MIFGNARGLSSQVVAIPMASFGILMNSPHSEFQRISPQKRPSVHRFSVRNFPHGRIVANWDNSRLYDQVELTALVKTCRL